MRQHSFTTETGDVVFSMRPMPGQRSCAIVASCSAAHNIVEGSFQQHGRACCIDLILHGRPTRLVCCHLRAKAGLAQYCQSLADVELLISTMPKQFEFMIGADVNDKLGFYDENLFPACVGVYADGPRGSKGQRAFSFFIEKLGLVALNTVSQQHDNNFTHWDVHDHEDPKVVPFAPRQIDFLFVGKLYGGRCARFLRY